MTDKPEAVRKTFPILGSRGQASVDLQMVLDHAGQAQKNHYQTVQRLAERGGLSWAELLAVLTDRGFDAVHTDEKANAVELCRAIEARYLAAVATPSQPDASARPAGSGMLERVTAWLRNGAHYGPAHVGPATQAMLNTLADRIEKGEHDERN